MREKYFCLVAVSTSFRFSKSFVMLFDCCDFPPFASIETIIAIMFCVCVVLCVHLQTPFRWSGENKTCHSIDDNSQNTNFMTIVLLQVDTSDTQTTTTTAAKCCILCVRLLLRCFKLNDRQRERDRLAEAKIEQKSIRTHRAHRAHITVKCCYVCCCSLTCSTV